ncbi:isochorismate pyruvate lyase [Monaibacterium marinum]|uniref:chorismate mutase n=2 Tax=Pontivivens marinum TaxID=1690039 RepID=A0A2C9CNP6_9RHOB|nr:isochorismate pyruvate lyase [Monaibacterium marinum]
MTHPTDCNSMAELRLGIDALDRELIALLTRRASFIDRAIQLKPAENLPARIDNRVEQVVSNVRHLATQQGLDPALAEDIWRTVIEWSIAREQRVLGD